MVLLAFCGSMNVFMHYTIFYGVPCEYIYVLHCVLVHHTLFYGASCECIYVLHSVLWYILGVYFYIALYFMVPCVIVLCIMPYSIVPGVICIDALCYILWSYV